MPASPTGAGPPRRRQGAAIAAVANERLERRRRRLLRAVLPGDVAYPGSRWWPGYRIVGPRIRLGLVWFVAVAIGLRLGPPVLAILYGLTSAVAASGARLHWLRLGRWSPLPLVLLLAAVPAAAAVAGPLVALIALAVLVVAIGIVALVGATIGLTPARASGAAVTVLRVALPGGVASAGLVALAVVESGHAIAVVLLISAFAAGDYVVGSASANAYEGPVAGLLTLAVVALSLGVVPPPGLNQRLLPWLAVFVAVGIPIGRLLGSLALPHGGRLAPALRRLDVLIVVAPATLTLSLLAG